MTNDNANTHKEFEARAVPGLLLLVLFVVLLIACAAGIGFGAILLEGGSYLPGGLLLAAAILVMLVTIFMLPGIKIVKPNEARVMTLFGKYIGTLRKDGIWWLNPFAGAMVMPKPVAPAHSANESSNGIKIDVSGAATNWGGTTHLSLKTMTLSTDKQKINDLHGNPIIISIMVIWRVVDTAKAMFDVDNYFEYLSVQSDSALRNIVRLYPYDIADPVAGDGDDATARVGHGEKTLRGSSQEIAQALRDEIQSKVAVAGLEITEARITHLAYAPEIAAAMLQRQQAAAIVDARQLIVEGAVGMVQMALNKLGEEQIVELDEERKASMVSNLMVVLCANKDAQPVVNSGSLY
jgi:regulator of protease activity HflC (stomatin/prohibitin superfamily)